MREPVWAIGLMSGTSLDGVDAALVRTDGMTVKERGPWLTQPYENGLRHKLREAVYGRGDIQQTEREMTLKHGDAVKALLKQANMKAKDVKVVGFHGQTLLHKPKEGICWQIGNGALLAEKAGIDVVNDFRRRDVAAGGEGAPLVPLYHAALARDMDLPVAILNIGGISNITWVGRSENLGEDILSHDILAFDMGPGNVLLNEWAFRHTGQNQDTNGELALKGKADEARVKKFLSDPFFEQHPPKSLDRNYFNLNALRWVSTANGAATLAAFTVAAVAEGQKYFPTPARHWYVGGGGRHNPAFMEGLKKALDKVDPVEALGWEGDALEAQAFAYLAVRSIRHLPISIPTTTGVNKPVTGGALHSF